ncbi:hypothetical protein R3P38DRAFT_3356577 [Favolaschia claudopus]|uniref:Nephrocystin 3-like N-terminal domain-containing protein n=1 Tax=Favolaschia claudopus TaxID=2862362 RepID=A0AAW0BE57_9AGAR
MSTLGELDLSALFAEFRALVKEIGGSEWDETESLEHLLRECNVQPTELKLRHKKIHIVMRNSKLFLDKCDLFFLSFSETNWIVGAVYGAVRSIVTIAAAKTEILEEVIAGLNDCFEGLPLVSQTIKEANPSNPDRRAILSVLKAFLTFVKDLKVYVGGEGESIKQRILRSFKSPVLLHKVQTARNRMRSALDLAQFGILVTHIKTQSERHLRGKIGRIVERLHCTNYEHHLAQYVAKTSSIPDPCSWSDTHPAIVRWLSYEDDAARLYITGNPGSGKSVFAAHIIQKLEKTVTKDGRGGLILYYFCGADPAVDPYSNLPQKTSFKAIAMSFLRQILSKDNRMRIADITVVEDFLEYALSAQSDKYRDADLQNWVVKFLSSFDTVRIVVDAIDQCEDAHRAGGLLSWIMNDITAHVLLVGCEGSPADKFLADWPKITLGANGTTQADLEAYSRHVVRSYIPEGHPVDDILVNDIVQRSENMFLYVYFLQNLIKDEDMLLFNPEKRLELLRKTPLGIFKMYSYYLHVQLQGFTQLPTGSGFDRILVILLQLLVFSPSAVTWEIFLEYLQASSLPPGLALTLQTIESVARRAGGVLFEIREATYRDGNRVRRHHIVPVHRTLIEYFQSPRHLFHPNGESPGSIPYTGLDTIFKAVAEKGPVSLLEMCCIALQNRPFQSYINQYQHAADVCRQCLDDSSPRGTLPGSEANREDVHCAQLRGQLCDDTAFSSCDTVEFEQQWLDRQWLAVRQDLEWSRRCSEDVATFLSDEDKAIPQSLRDEINRLRFVLPRMMRHLEICQRALSELQTWHLAAYAFRNVIYYLHLTNQQAARTQCYPDFSSFEGLIKSYLDQLNLLLSAVAWDILPSLSPTDSTSSAAKLAALVCALEPVIAATQTLISSRKKPCAYQFFRVLKCLWLTRGILPNTEGIWNPLHSADIIGGFQPTWTSPDRLIRVTFERVLRLLADGEQMCFTQATFYTGVGNLSFCVRQIRQLMAHYLLLRTSDSGKAKSALHNDPTLEELGKQGFTKLVLLRDVSYDAVDAASQPPDHTSPGGLSSLFVALAAITGFLTFHYSCIIFSLFSSLGGLSHGRFRESTWTRLPVTSAAGIVGCSSAQLQSMTSPLVTLAVGGVTAVLLLSQRRVPNVLVLRTLAALTAVKYWAAATSCLVLLLLVQRRSLWSALHAAALLYGNVYLSVFVLDPSGMKRRNNELARIGRKYTWHREEPDSDLLGDRAPQM